MSARGLEADFKPATTIETELVERLAGLLWRLRRVPVFEAALMQARRVEVGQRDFMSLFSHDERKQIDELKHWLWQEREATSRPGRLITPDRKSPALHPSLI